jgi:hypothetical protein
MRNSIKFRFAGIFMILAMCAVFGLAAMLLWNVLMPPIFALPQISYLQAVGLLVLARLLFGGIGGGGWRHHHHGGHGARDKLREKLLNSHLHDRFHEHFGDEETRPHRENSEKKETNNE